MGQRNSNRQESRGRRAVRGAWWATVALATVALALPLTGTPAGAAASVTPLGAIGYGYLAQGTGPNAGNVYAVNYYSGTVYQVAADGATSVYSSGFGGYSIWAITSDASGDLYVDSYYGGYIDKIAPNGSVTLYASGADLYGIWGMAFNSATGVLYASNGTNIYQVSTGGATTLFAAGAGGDGLALDAQGNLFSTANGSTIYEVSPGGSISTFATGVGAALNGLAIGPSGDLYAAQASPAEIWRVTPSGVASLAVPESQFAPTPVYLQSVAFDTLGNLYAVDGGASGTFEVWKIVGADAPPTPTSLTVTETSGEVTASWYGSSSDTSYTCTLMYGFGNPSQFSVTTTTPSCTFQGLDTTVAYGVQVVAGSDGATSAPAVAFGAAVPAAPTKPAPHKKTIVCGKGRALKAVTGVNPHCPAGWVRKG